MKSGKTRIGGDRGFTLIEILIVVILLGIIASIIIPQITVSSEDAKLNTLKTNLSSLRSAIELYYYQHGNRYPGQYDEANGTDELDDATEAANAFVAQLTQYSNAEGKVTADSAATGYGLGPYLRDGLPINPYNNNRKVTCDVATTSVATRVANPSDGTGWKFYTNTGIMIANDHMDHDGF